MFLASRLGLEIEPSPIGQDWFRLGIHLESAKNHLGLPRGGPGVVGTAIYFKGLFCSAWLPGTPQEQLGPLRRMLKKLERYSHANELAATDFFGHMPSSRGLSDLTAQIAELFEGKKEENREDEVGDGE